MSETAGTAKKLNDLGAVWKRTGSKGVFYSGSLDIDRLETAIAEAKDAGAKAVCIMLNNNTHKTSDKQPDIRVSLGRPYVPKAKEPQSGGNGEW